MSFATLYDIVAAFALLLALAGLIDKRTHRSTYVLLGAVGLAAGALIVWLAATSV